jgi:hypothetical protein
MILAADDSSRDFSFALEWMCELDETKRIILGKTFRNTESVKSFIAAIADVEFLKVAKLITDSKFICINNSFGFIQLTHPFIV